MTDATAEIEEPPKRKKLVPLLLGVVLAAAGAGGGYMSVTTGLIQFSGEKYEEKSGSTEKVAFVAIDPVVVSIGPSNVQRHLRFQAQLEVAPDAQAEITGVLPRIVDVLNGYLRAVDISDLEDPGALIRLRAQMLRRVQIIVGPDKVSDLLVMEFVLN